MIRTRGRFRKTHQMLERLKATGQKLKREIRVYRFILADPRTPRAARWLLALAVGYAALPFDVVPDFIPVVGHLDDVIIVSGLLLLALWMVPKQVVQECRDRARDTEDRPRD